MGTKAPTPKGSMVEYLDEFPRMIVMQTFSKAWASAAMRLGVSYASQEIIEIYNKVKYPYNINILTQRQALKVLDDIENIKRVTAEILDARNQLVAELAMIDEVEKIFPSDANFVLVQVKNANALYAFLRDNGVIVRNRSRVNLCGNCLRITVGNDEENKLLIEIIQEYGAR